MDKGIDMRETKGILQVCCLLFGLSCGSSALGELQSRAGGTMVYDSLQDITWLADANYASTEMARNCGEQPLPGGIVDPDGGMDWYTAVAWVENLEFGGYDDWRLPRTAQPDPTCDDQSPVVDSYGFDCTGSELGHLFYVGLGGEAGRSITEVNNENFELFENIVTRTYWYENQWPIAPLIARNLHMDLGFQNANAKSVHLLVWPVRDGDVAEDIIVEPAGDGVSCAEQSR